MNLVARQGDSSHTCSDLDTASFSGVSPAVQGRDQIETNLVRLGSRRSVAYAKMPVDQNDRVITLKHSGTEYTVDKWNR